MGKPDGIRTTFSGTSLYGFYHHHSVCAGYCDIQARVGLLGQVGLMMTRRPRPTLTATGPEGIFEICKAALAPISRNRRGIALVTEDEATICTSLRNPSGTGRRTVNHSSRKDRVFTGPSFCGPTAGIFLRHTCALHSLVAEKLNSFPGFKLMVAVTSTRSVSVTD